VAARLVESQERWLREREANTAKLREQKAREEEAECTFHPRINASARGRPRISNFAGPALFEKNQRWLLLQQEKIRRERERKEAEALDGCTFRPKLNRGSARAARGRGGRPEGDRRPATAPGSEPAVGAGPFAASSAAAPTGYADRHRAREAGRDGPERSGPTVASTVASTPPSTARSVADARASADGRGGAGRRGRAGKSGGVGGGACERGAERETARSARSPRTPGERPEAGPDPAPRAALEKAVWTEYVTDDGYVYEHNHETGETRWADVGADEAKGEDETEGRGPVDAGGDKTDAFLKSFKARMEHSR
jgi:hypothetical protein